MVTIMLGSSISIDDKFADKVILIYSVPSAASSSIIVTSKQSNGPLLVTVPANGDPVTKNSKGDSQQ